MSLIKNSKIYVNEKNVEFILRESGMNGLLLYLEAYSIKNLNHWGKTRKKYVSYDILKGNSIIATENEFNKTAEKLVKLGFFEKKGSNSL